MSKWRTALADDSNISVLDRYEARIAEGLIDADNAQAKAAARLDDLARRLANKDKGGWFSKPAPVHGLYMWGGVGRGKSMLMDLFFEAAPVTPKRRVHFHEFMGSVHDMLGEWRKLDAVTMARQGSRRRPDRASRETHRLRREPPLL